MGYVAEPQGVAGIVAFLASDDARYVTGQSILIDGGRWDLTCQAGAPSPATARP